MSDDFVVRPVVPMQNINRLAPADRDRGKSTKNFYEKNKNRNADEHNQNARPDSSPNESTDNSSDGHSIDIKA